MREQHQLISSITRVLLKAGTLSDPDGRHLLARQAFRVSGWWFGLLTEGLGTNDQPPVMSAE